jgi:transketolase C-terminal domain/subunit
VIAHRERFPVGGSKVLRSTDAYQMTLVGAGVTLHECLRAADLLASDGLAVRVIDCYSVKPIDASTPVAAVSATSFPRALLVVTMDKYGVALPKRRQGHSGG